MRCDPSDLFADSDVTLPEVEAKCTSDDSCVRFYKNGTSGVYFKCAIESKKLISFKGDILYSKGIFSV